MIVQDATRTQCRIKALFRGRGIATAGKSVYGFSAVILIGAAGYALTGALYVVANRTRR